MAFTNLTNYSSAMTPLTNISPLTYRDASTFLEYLETIQDYINNTLTPDTNAAIANAITEYQAGIDKSIQAYTDFINNATVELAGLNDASIGSLVADPNSETSKAFTNFINTLAVLPANLDDLVSARVGDTASKTAGAIKTLMAGPIDESQTEILALVTPDIEAAQARADAHKERHTFGGVDQIAVDRRQLVEPVRDWVREKLRLTPGAPFRIVFSGDSQTNDGSYEKPTERPDVWGGGKGYSYRLANLLTKGGVQSAQAGTTGVTTNNQPGAHVWSTAVAGSRSDTYMPAGTVANISAVNPDLVFHMIGTNDFAAQIVPAAYKTNVLKALNDVWGVAPNARQVLIVCWPRVNPDGMVYGWNQYTDALREIAEQFKNDTRFTLIDHGAEIDRTGGAGLTPWWSSFPDSIHALPSYHRMLAEELTTWMGLPSPMAAFGTTRVIQGSAFVGAALDDANPASSLDIHAVPVPRTVTFHVRALATVNGEGDFHIQEFGDSGAIKTYPFHVQPESMRNKNFTLQIEIPPNTSRYYYLSGTSNITLTTGGSYDQYNQFWAEASYI